MRLEVSQVVLPKLVVARREQGVVSYLDTLRVGCGSACIFLDDTTGRPRLYCYSQPILLAQTLP